MEPRRHSFEYEDLLACGRGELFGAGNAQLPLPPMLMFDRITLIDNTGGGLPVAAQPGGPRHSRRWFGCSGFRLYKLSAGQPR